MRDDVEGVSRVAAVGARTCRKWMSWPSMVVVNCGYSLSFASHWRQSYPFSVSSARYTQ